jgi:hypothetical protein
MRLKAIGTLQKDLFRLAHASKIGFCFHDSDECGRRIVQHHQSEPAAYGGVPLHRVQRCSAHSQQEDHAHCALYVYEQLID